MSPPFPIGQKVVCTNSSFPAAAFNHFRCLPKEGGIYTIADVFWGVEHGTGETVMSIQLAEFPPHSTRPGGFSLWRFRLLEDLKELEAMVQPLALSA